MKSFWIFTAICLINITLSYADIKNKTTKTAQVTGTCSSCKKGIETAAFEKNTAQAEWDSQTQIATITFDNRKTTLDAVLRKIALSGYDNQRYLAPADAVSKIDACCQSKRQQVSLAAQTARSHQHAMSTKATESTPLQAVLSTYYALTDALVNANGELASKKANELLKAIKDVKMSDLAGEQHMAWMKVEKDLAFDADHIAETKDIAHQRDHFSTLSENMYKLVKPGKNTEPVYYQHCPMANNGKGANWLSPVSNIQNPYFGAQMLTCGKTTEILK